jgi:hypothetical protein
MKTTYKYILATGAAIILLCAFVIFKDKNNPEISSLDISDNPVEEVNGKERIVVKARQFKRFFYNNLGFEDHTLFDAYDEEYVLVTEKDVLKLESAFFDYLKENKIQYKPNEKDCDDFAKIFSRIFADKWNAGKDYKAAPAVGYFAYLNRNDVPHMIVVAFSEKDGMLHPMFFETRPHLMRVDVNEVEFLSMIGGEFN